MSEEKGHHHSIQPTHQLGTAQVQGLPSTWQRWVQNAGIALIFGGLLLIAVGVYTPIKNGLELMNNQPPPAAIPAEANFSLADNPLPVIEADSAVALTATATPTTPPTETPTPAQIPVEASGSAADTLPTATPTDTPPPTDTPTPDPYPPASSVPSRVVAESIGLDSEVKVAGWHQETINGQSVSVWDVVDYAAGWHKNSVLPGHVGNVVLSGHHNIAGQVFRYLVDLEPGDKVTLFADGIPYDYWVEDKFILKDKGEPEEIRKENARWIGAFNDKRLTMVTCWPFTNNTHRVVVIAKPAN